MNPRTPLQAPSFPEGSYGTFASVYDRLMADMPYGEWLAWLDAYWTRYGRPRAVVDLGCGTGTVAIPLAQTGMHVTGIDLSDEMIGVARRKEAACRAELHIPGTIRWVCGDMREWSLPEPVEGAVSLCDCLNYLPNEADLFAAFRRTCEGIVPGGSFLFDMHHPNQFEQWMANEPFCLDDEDVSYIWTCSPGEEAATIEHRMTFFVAAEAASGRFDRIRETHRQRAYAAPVVLRLLAEAGFAEAEAYADFTFGPVDDATTMRMFFAARKAGV